MSAPTILCSWCDVEAIYADGRVVAQKDDERQYACENHKRDLLASIESDLWHSGNPFAGEAAEAWIKDMEGYLKQGGSRLVVTA